MSSFAQQLIASLHEAAAGDFTRFTIQGQAWVRHDVGSPEHQLSEARSAIADMTTEIDVLRSERAAARVLDGTSPKNLSELIGKCPKTYLFKGDHFPFRLAWHCRDDTWVAGYLVVQDEGKTPEEAVARLLLEPAIELARRNALEKKGEQP